MITTGKHFDANEALAMGIFNKIYPTTNFKLRAIEYAKEISKASNLLRLSEVILPDSQEINLGEILKVQRQKIIKKNRHFTAPLKAIDCIEYAYFNSFNLGIEYEKKIFEELELSQESKAFIYAFMAEKQASKIKDFGPFNNGEIFDNIAIVGAGTMGGTIAMAIADAGKQVKILDLNPEIVQLCIAKIQKNYEISIQRGSLTQSQMYERLRLIQPVTEYHSIANCDVVIEAVYENIEIKKNVFQQLDLVMKENALLLTNSSAIDIDLIAKATQRPQNVAGSHFFVPANVMKLCEVVKGTYTSPETILRTLHFGKSIKKICAVAGSCDGFVANRSRTPMMTEMLLMLEEGVSPVQVDKVMMDFGYPLGPFAVNDISGLDISYESRKRRALSNPNYRKLHVPDRLVEIGRKGQKSGIGWYRYNPGSREPIPDESLKEITEQIAKEFNIKQRTFTNYEILTRLLFASVNEACKILEEGKAFRASDIDVMWLNGFGFPRHKGGLMYWADTVGAKMIYQKVCDWYLEYGSRWEPSLLLKEVAESGKSFIQLKGL